MESVSDTLLLSPFVVPPGEHIVGAGFKYSLFDRFRTSVSTTAPSESPSSTRSGASGSGPVIVDLSETEAVAVRVVAIGLAEPLTVTRSPTDVADDSPHAAVAGDENPAAIDDEFFAGLEDEQRFPPVTPTSATRTPFPAGQPTPVGMSPTGEVAVNEAGSVAAETLRLTEEFSSQVAARAVLMATSVADGRCSKFAEELKKSIENAFVDVRGGLGQRFQQWMKDPEHREEYDKYVNCKVDEGNKTQNVKAAFRVEWAKKELSKIELSKDYTKSYEEVEKDTGTYRVFACLVEKLGFRFDPKGAVRRATAYAERCIALGGKWCLTSDMHNEVEFYHLKKEHQTIMNEKWRLKQSEMQAAGAQAKVAATGAKPADPKEGAAAASAGVAQGKIPKGKQPEKGNKRKDAADAQSPEDGAKKMKGESNALKDLMNEAGKVKRDYHAAASAATSMIASIQTATKGGPWHWAKGDEDLGVLKDLHQSLLDAVNADCKEFLIKDLSVLKKSIGHVQLMKLLKEFVKVCTEVKALKDHSVKLLGCYDVRNK